MPDRMVDWKKNGMLIHSFEIEIEYVHNLKELYKRLHFWLEDNGWKDLWGRDDYEVRYWQRDLPGGLFEHHIWWRAWRHPGSMNHDNELFKYFFKIDYQTIAMSRKEIMHKGKKWKLDKGTTIMRVKSYLVIDWQKGWDKGFLKGMKARFQQWFYRDRIEQEQGNLFNITADFQNEIKRYLELAQDREQPPNVYPPNMLP